MQNVNILQQNAKLATLLSDGEKNNRKLNSQVTKLQNQLQHSSKQYERTSKQLKTTEEKLKQLSTELQQKIEELQTAEKTLNQFLGQKLEDVKLRDLVAISHIQTESSQRVGDAIAKILEKASLCSNWYLFDHLLKFNCSTVLKMKEM